MNHNQVIVRRWLYALMAVILAAVLLPIPVQAVQQDTPRFDPAPCMFDLLPGVVEGTDVLCGYVVVPEQHADPTGPTIRLAVAILKSKAENPAPDPFVMLQGGPGGSTIEDFSTPLLSTSRLLTNRDIILFDQRGTFYSEPSLTCPEYDQLTLETLNQDLSDEENERLFLQAMQACRQRLVDEGVNLSAFDSAENAADVDDLRRALGYDQINLYGVSYGTLLALHVMRDYAEGLRSVILDSVVPPQQNFITETAQSQKRSFRKLFDACAADTACNQEYPNLEQVFYTLVDGLNERPVTIQLTDAETGETHPALFNGDALISTLFQMLYSTDLIPLLPRIIYDARAGDYNVIERILSLVVFDQSMSLGMYYSVLCAEDADFQPQDVDLSDLPPQIEEVEKNSGESFLRTCQAWDVEPLGPEIDEPVSSDIPTLVLTGDFDPITPPAFGELAAQTLSNSYFYTFPAGGHGAVMSGECQDQLILTFLDNPNQAPDASCIGDQTGPDFITTGSLVRLPVLPKLLNLQGSSGVEMILYGLGLLFLVTALGVYPLVWLVRLITRKPAAVATEPLNASTYNPSVSEVQPAQARLKPAAWRWAPWLAVLVSLLLIAFTVVLIGIIANMIAQNDIRFLMGLPGSAAPLFILPVLTTLLVLVMLGLVLAAWLRGWGSVWGRLYFSLLCLSAVVVHGVLGVWGMLTALITG